MYLGVDPGASGGLAALGDEGVVNLLPMPSEERDILSWALRWDSEDSVAVIEAVGGYMNFGKKWDGERADDEDRSAAARGTRMFAFGRNVGLLQMALVAAGFDDGRNMQSVGPAAWQRAVGAPTRGRKTKSQHKAALRDHAVSLYPGVKITLKTADALLLAHYCRDRRLSAVALLSGLRRTGP